MRFDILGPLEVYDEGQLLPLKGRQQPALLAALLLNANQVVSMDRLVACLWTERPPAAARSLVQGCVADLRRTLGQDTDSARQPLVTRAPGYYLRVGPGELDLDQFEELVAEAQRPGVGPQESAVLLHRALSLWRGPALDGVALDAFHAEVARLEERRLMVQEWRIDVDLRLGRHASAASELESLVRAHPLRERFWAQLMLAQYHCDRQADALATFQRLRDVLVERLGVEPGGPLQRLHAAILSGADPWQAYRGDGPQSTPVGSAAAAAVAAVGEVAGEVAGTATEPPAGAPTSVPAQLPSGVTAFTGRDAHLAELDALLSTVDGTAAVGVVSGAAGVGKTALTVHWAYRVRERFPDGQLFVNLNGFASVPPTRPIEALAGFLQALGVPAEQVPVEVPPAAALYRTLLADKRVLVVLDNAVSAEQVRPLLPGSPACVAVVTSRNRLGGMVARDGARHLTLDVLDRAEAVTLLTRLLGIARVRPEQRALVDLADRCDRLPLALRIAAANLTLHPQRGIRDAVAALAGGNRLNALEVDDDESSAVRAAFDLSYHALPQPARRLFRWLGATPAASFTAPAGAALVGCTVDEVTPLLDRLSRAHLVDDDGFGRFRMHDLLRLYASERAQREDHPEARDAAMRRLFAWYLGTADAAARLLYPDAMRLPLDADSAAVPAFGDHAAALAWFDAEIANLVATVQHTAEHGPYRVAWLLADTLRGYFMLRVLPVEWAATTRAGLSAAEAEDVPRAQVAVELSIASLHLRQSRYESAIEHNQRALAINQRAGWDDGESAALGNLGTVYLMSGQLHAAAEYLARALQVDRRTGWLAGQAVKLGNLGVVSTKLGRLQQAAEQLREALSMFAELGSRYGEAIGAANLGSTLHQLGRYPEALHQLHRALALSRELGDRANEADNQTVLAELHLDAGRLSTAYDLASTALARAVDVGERHYEANARNVLGTIHLRQCGYDRADEYFRDALDVARQTGSRMPEVVALIGLAEVRDCTGDPERARRYAAQAASLGRSTDHRVLEGRALVALANATLGTGRFPEAVELANRALDLQRSTGYRLGAAQALVTLGNALSPADPTAARVQWHRAKRIFKEIGAARPPRPMGRRHRGRSGNM